MVDSAGEDESDDELMYLNRRKAAKKRNRRRLLGGLRRRRGVGAGTREKPVLLDLEVDEDEGGEQGGGGERERGVREGSKFRGSNGGEEMRAIEGSGYQEAGAAGAGVGDYQEVGAAGTEGGAADGIEVLLGVQGSQTQGRS